MSISRWMDKEMWYIHNVILLSYKKEHIWVSSNEVDEPRAYYTEWSESERERQISYINAYIWNLEGWHWRIYWQGSNGEDNGTPIQYSYLESPMDGGAWWAAAHGVAKSRTRLSNFTFTFHFHILEKEMATTPVFLPGESQGRGSLVGCRFWGHTESDTTEAT